MIPGGAGVAAASRLEAFRSRIQASDRYPRTLLVTCLLGMFCTTFTVTILTVSINVVADDLNSTPAVIAWVVTAPMLVQAVAMPILGRIGDMRGHRRVYLVGFSLTIVFSILTAAAWSPLSLIVFRCLAQLAGTATVPASFAMLFRAFPPEQRVRASAWASGTLSGASVTGLAIGGVVIDNVGWRPLFLIQAGLAAAALVPAFLVLAKDVHRVKVRLDRAGALALAVSAFALSFGANRAAAWGLHPVVIGLAVLLPFALWALVRIERRAEAPVIPLGLLELRDIRAAGAASFFMNGAHMSSFLVTPLLLLTVFGYSATATSLLTLARTLSISLSAPIASRIGMRIGERQLAVVAATVMSAGMAALGVGAGTELIAVVLLSMVLSGFAFGHGQPSMLTLAGNAVESEHFGLVTSLQQTAGQIGAVTAMGAAAAIIGDSTASGPFAFAYGMAAVLALVAAGAASTAGRRVRRPVSPAAATSPAGPTAAVAGAVVGEGSGGRREDAARSGDAGPAR